MNYNAILREIVSLIQEYQSGSGSSIAAQSKQYETSIVTQYRKIKDQGYLDEFYQYLYQEFHNEPDVYTLLLSILYKSTQEERCLQLIMNLLIEDKIDVFHSIGIRHQIEYGIFTNPLAGKNYELRRKVHKLQLEKLEEALESNYLYLPWEQRNSNRIIIITNQILAMNHAPTRNVFELCSALIDLGMDVLLVVAFEKADQERLSQSWIIPQIMNCFENYNGNFKLDYYNHIIKGYQFFISRDTIPEMRSILNDIYLLKPQIVWHMGGTSVYADLISRFTTVVSMPFSDGFTISEAPVMLEHTPGRLNDYNEVKQCLINHKQVPIHFDYNQVIRSSNHIYSRKDFQLSEDAFLIAVVGNRLEDELSNSFIGVLQEILELSSKAHIVFIGEMKEARKEINSERSSYLGPQNDLLGVLGLMNVFINPPRKGGGTSALWALYNGVPIITLNNCDVAGYVNKEFICDNEPAMVQKTLEYINDNCLYQKHKLLAKQLATAIEEKNDVAKSITKLLAEIKTVVLEQEQCVSAE